MLKKIKAWWSRWKAKEARTSDAIASERGFYTREQVEAAFELGKQDGRREGLELAKQQAVNSLRQVLKQQNKQ